MTTQWKFTDSGNHSVSRQLDNGGSESRLSSALSAAELAAVLPATPQVWSSTPLLTAVRAARELCLDRLTGIAFAAQAANDAATVQACLTARTSLLNITTVPAVLAATDDASLKAALVAAYAAIVAAAPANVKNAFAGFNL